MKSLSFLSAVAGGLLLAACATPYEVCDVNTIKTSATPSGGSVFSRSLFDEYKAYAKYEVEDEFEWSDAAIFARKGLAAAQGSKVEPEKLSDWTIPAKSVADLTAARERLLGYLSGSAMSREPALTAKAQVMFDCWVEEENEKHSYSDCRSKFITIEPLLKEPEVASPAPAYNPQEANVYRTYIVYFDFNKSVITPVGQKTLEDLAAYQSELQTGHIYVTGHTDTVGAGGYNKRLSDKRARAVTSALSKLGLSSSIVTVDTFGKKKLAVPTADNTRETLNRRVEIYLEK